MRGDEVVVRGVPITLRRIEDMWQCGDGKRTIPFVPAIAGNGNQATPVRASRRCAHCLISNIALHVAPDHILSGRAAIVTRCLELLPRVRLIHPEARQIRCCTGIEPSRSDYVSFVV